MNEAHTGILIQYILSVSNKGRRPERTNTPGLSVTGSQKQLHSPIKSWKWKLFVEENGLHGAMSYVSHVSLP